MLDLLPPEYRFCPFCGKPLSTLQEENKSRRCCTGCDWVYYPRVAASVTGIIMKNRMVLLVKRLCEPFRGMWMFPSGFVDFGEHPEEALAREIHEETGLVVSKAGLLGCFQSPDDPREPGHLIFFYAVQVEPGEIRTEVQENEAIGWFDLDSLPQMGWALHNQFASSLRSGALVI